MINLLIAKTILIGIGATITFDLWAQFLKFTFKITPSNICVVGRWLLYMPQGIFRHTNIIKAPVKRGECFTGWIAHYSIGVTLTLLYLILVPVHWLFNPTLLPALLYGICTVVFPLFVLQPSLGLGIASSKTSNPTFARIKSIMTHIIFGIGLWLSTIAANYSILNWI